MRKHEVGRESQKYILYGWCGGRVGGAVVEWVVRWSSGNTLVYHSRGPRFNSRPGHCTFQKCFKCFPPN
ncbi:hypothetical protein DPMN_073165 [Dreissena polymorpha]|uniref:Uncharacterized protein n=1 Tax=Dreissena polymorpha TaxID=45954 RepID=A0A9D4BYJ0_DREPO|nr:hypothetical protein DPMN_073165 [Dreissena polymorpha]